MALLKDSISPFINLDPMILKDDKIQDLKRQRKANDETFKTLQQLINMVNTTNPADLPIYLKLSALRDELGTKQLIVTADLLDLLL